MKTAEEILNETLEPSQFDALTSFEKGFKDNVIKAMKKYAKQFTPKKSRK